MTIKETGGVGLTLAAPKVTLVLKEGDKTKVQAQFNSIEVFDEKNSWPVIPSP